MADELDDAIRENAQKPAKASGDGESVEQHPLPDQIAAAQYLAGKTAVRRRNRGLRFSQIEPPGASS